jgi:glycerol kinase
MRTMSIGLDIGSSSVKAVRTAPAGRDGGRRGAAHAAGRRGARVVGRPRPLVTRRRRGGRVEQDPGAILGASLAALRDAAAGLPAGRPAALGIATQRSTILFWDRDTGRPLTPALSWQDVRGEELCEAVLRRRSALVPGSDSQAAAIAARTGLRISPHYSAPKLAWALRHVRSLRRRLLAGRVLWGTLGTWVAWHLSGGALYAIDHANAQRTLLLDIDTLTWDPGLFAAFDLEPLLEARAVPALLPTVLARERGGLPLTCGAPFRLAAMTGDQQAALIGLGCRAEGEVAINYGSGAFVLINTGARRARAPGLLTTLVASWRDGRDGRGTSARFAIEGTVNAAATAIDWAERRLRVHVRTRELDAFLGPDDGRRRVHFLPAVAGVGAPHWDPEARPRFAGDVAGASAPQLMRAVVESIALRCAEIVRTAEAGAPSGASAAAGAPPGGGAGRRDWPILAAGGLTRCRALLQAQADLLQRPIAVRDFPDATGRGAALLAAVSPARLFGARETAPSRGTVFRPRISADEAESRFRCWERAVYGRR